MAGRLAGKVALITGGAAGIGEATAKVFAREGAKVVVGDVVEAGGAETAAAIRRAGGDAQFVKTNVAREEEVARMVSFTVQKYGRLDILFNNAGVEEMKPEVDTSVEEWDRVMSINVTGVFLCTKHAIPEMKKGGGGSIINVSSIFGLVGSPGWAAYHASKGAVRLFTKSTALAHGVDNIRANSIHPGPIETRMLAVTLEAEADPAAARTQWLGTLAIGRLGRPEDIAFGALFLASDESSFVTGSELVIDGGYTAR
jgi:NAD(P)-dependent dehydrogenase (short-subunit alcohol dehydrogenase family)